MEDIIDVKPSGDRQEEEDDETETIQKRSMMENSSATARTDSGSSSEQQKPETLSSKKRKTMEKTVVALKISAGAKKLNKSGGPPSDSWSWRKYGQKPIKGSPYPRGYYRCSTSKGCSAKKQVERSKTDDSMIIITYTSTHNHPSREERSYNLNNEKLPHCGEEEAHNTPKEENDEDDQLLYFQPPFIHHEDVDSLIVTLDKTNDSFNLLLDQEPLSYTNLMNFSSMPKSEENDFFDELEELPITSSSFTSFMSNFLDEKTLVLPSISTM